MNAINKIPRDEAAIKFLTLVRTKQLIASLYQPRGHQTNTMEPVHIGQKEIETLCYPYPKYNRKAELEILVQMNELSITKKLNKNGREAFYYSTLREREVDLSLIKPRKQTLNIVTVLMKQNLKHVSLLEGAASTPYFDAFLNGKNYLDLFFFQDLFSGRIHTPVSNFHRILRPNILIADQRTISFDVSTMQPLLLGKILKEQIGENEFSNWIDSGIDIYEMVKEKAGLKTRQEGKDLVLQKLLFCKSNEALNKLFGNANWIIWINKYKSSYEPLNKNSKTKPHSNMAWLLQTTEVRLMKKIWARLLEEEIIFLTVHDEIIVQIKNGEKAQGIMHEVLNKELTFFKLTRSDYKNNLKIFI